MTGDELNQNFGQQQPPDLRAFVSINALNYKLTDLAQLIERLLPAGAKREQAFAKMVELKAAIDCAAIS